MLPTAAQSAERIAGLAPVTSRSNLGRRAVWPGVSLTQPDGIQGQRERTLDLKWRMVGWRVSSMPQAVQFYFSYYVTGKSATCSQGQSYGLSSLL